MTLIEGLNSAIRDRECRRGCKGYWALRGRYRDKGGENAGCNKKAVPNQSLSFLIYPAIKFAAV
jgi:hypothetical protein